MDREVKPVDILNAKQIEVANARRDIRLGELQDGVSALVDPARNLGTIHGDRIGIIGEIRPPEHALANFFDPRIWGQELAGAGCTAVAVCTDNIAHEGDRFYCRRARKYMPLPIIRLDYIISEYQIWESRLNLADAVTITEPFLGDSEILDLLGACRRAGIAGMVAVEDAEGCARAVDLGVEYVVALPLLWDEDTWISEETVREMIALVPETSKFVVYAPVLEPEYVCELAVAGVNAVICGFDEYDPTVASQGIRQLIDVERSQRDRG